jgi:nucleotide-binding universal stress UspA family protein
MKAKPSRQRKVWLEVDDKDTQQLARSARLHESARRGSSEAGLFRRILIAVDFSDTSREALRRTVEMARLLSSEVFCLHVIEVPYGAGEAAFIAQNMKERSRAEKNRRRELAQLLEEKGCDSANVKVVAGTPYHEILKEATEANVDLIVVGSHGNTGVKRVVLGSTSERVIRHSECPVLVYRLEKREQKTKRSGKLMRTAVS